MFLCNFAGEVALAAENKTTETMTKEQQNQSQSVNRCLRFALFGNEYQVEKAVAIQRVLDFLAQRGAEVFVDSTFYDFIRKHHLAHTEVTGIFDGDDFEVDYVISLGGDGTFLKAASRVGSKQTPIIGVNMGRLGFLANVLPSEVEEMLGHLYDAHFKIENHTAIMIETDGEPLQGSPYALNDIAVLKRDHASMISIQTEINGDYLVTYQADGLIVSTPTGSTAYSLSNGGPVIVPQSGNLCLTAVAPHSLNIRPIVIGDDNAVTLRVESRTHNFLVAIDGRSERLTENTTVTIRKAPFPIRIVKRTGQRYFSTLREKMMWGSDFRLALKE